jgi:hypothetical protein
VPRERGPLGEARSATGGKNSLGFRIEAHPVGEAYLGEAQAKATLQAQVTKVGVIRRAAEMLDIAQCLRPFRYDDTGVGVYLKSPNLSIAEKMVARLGDAVSAWGERGADQPAGGRNIVNLILGGQSLADAMIHRIQPPADGLPTPVIEHESTH